MNGLKDLEEYVSNHGPIRIRDLELAGFRRQDVKPLEKSGRLVKLSRGIYNIPGAPPLEFPTYTEVFLRTPEAVLCLQSALEFHHLTTQLPHRVWIAIEERSRAPKQTGLEMEILRFSGPAFHQGIEEHLIDGVRIRVYSKAKTVADLFRMRHRVGLDIALEALRETIREGQTTRRQILEFARMRHVEKLIQPYMEMEAIS